METGHNGCSGALGTGYNAPSDSGKGRAGRVLVRDPACVDGVHENAVRSVALGGGAGHHVEAGLRHVGVRVLWRLEAVELPLHCGHVDDEPLPLRLRPRLGSPQWRGPQQAIPET